MMASVLTVPPRTVRRRFAERDPDAINGGRGPAVLLAGPQAERGRRARLR